MPALIQENSSSQLAEVVSGELKQLRAQVEGIVHGVIRLTEDSVLGAAANISGINEEAKKHADGLRAVTARYGLIADAIRQQVTYATAASVRLKEQNELASQSLDLADRIGRLAGSLDRISMQARMLTLNGQIEAGRLGQQGAPFTIIVGQLRSLSGQVEEAGATIADLAASLQQVLPRFAENARVLLEMTERFQERGVAESQQNSVEVERLVRAALSESHSRAERIREGTGNLLAHMQFQDRVAQELGDVPNQIRYVEDLLGSTLAQLSEGEVGDVTKALQQARALVTQASNQLGKHLVQNGAIREEAPVEAGTLLLF